MNRVLVGDSAALELPGEAGAGELVCAFVRDLLVGDEEEDDSDRPNAVVDDLRDAVESLLAEGEGGRLRAVLEITPAGVEVTLTVGGRRSCPPILVPAPAAT